MGAGRRLARQARQASREAEHPARVKRGAMHNKRFRCSKLLADKPLMVGTSLPDFAVLHQTPSSERTACDGGRMARQMGKAMGCFPKKHKNHTGTDLLCFAPDTYRTNGHENLPVVTMRYKLCLICRAAGRVHPLRRSGGVLVNRPIHCALNSTCGVAKCRSNTQRSSPDGGTKVDKGFASP